MTERTTPDTSSRRRYLKRVAISGTAVTLAGCSGNGDGTDAGDGGSQATGNESPGDSGSSQWADLSGQELRLLTQAASTPYQEYWNDLTNAFQEATGASVSVEYVGFGTGLRDRIAQLLQAGSPPELAHIGLNSVATYGAQGQLADHTEAVEYWIDQWGDMPEHMRFEGDSGGDSWVPMFANPWTNWYRADVFEEEPNTWESELAMAREHDEGQGGTRGTALVLADGAFSTNVDPLNYAWGNGASFCERVDGDIQVVMDNDENRDLWIEALEHELELHEYSMPGNDVSDDNMDGLVSQGFSYQIRTSGTRPKVQAEGTDVAEHIAPTSVPTNGTQNWWGNVQGYTSFAEANTEAAMEFLKFWAEPNNLLGRGSVTGGFFFPTPLHNAPVQSDIRDAEQFQAGIESLPDHWQVPRDLQNQEFVADSIDIANEPEGMNPYAGVLFNSYELAGLHRDVLLEGVPPGEALSERASNLQAVIDETSI